MSALAGSKDEVTPVTNSTQEQLALSAQQKKLSSFMLQPLQHPETYSLIHSK